MKKLLLLLFSTLFFISAFADCPAGENELVVLFISDSYIQETSWSIEDLDGNVYFERDFATDTFYNITVESLYFGEVNTYDTLTPYLVENELKAQSVFYDTICLPANTCMNFAIFDEFDDGICCSSNANGSYTLVLNGDTLFMGGDFNTTETTTFNCNNGFDCTTASEVFAGNQYTAPQNNAFYVFTPETTGLYNFTTCFPSNTCPTRIWIYGDCIGTNLEDAEGFIDYATNTCADGQTELPIGMEAGVEYHVRIGIDNDSCGIAPTLWELVFEGEIEGCMDTTACNYDPTATLEGNCMYPGDPNCPSGPDLTIIEEVTASTIHVSQLEVSPDDAYQSCFIEEGCMTGFGIRDVLIFDTRIENVGDLDWYVGQAPASSSGISNEFWEYSSCHNHYHYKGYAEYTLYDEDGNEIPAGFKAGFCVQDSDCSINQGSPKYSCGNQGLSAGCGDVYPGIDTWSGLPWDCQWLDVTEVVDGSYTFVMRVNWNQQADQLGRVETTYENNAIQICLELSTNPAGFKEVDVITDCEIFVDCAGVLYGDAQPDCTGVCNGAAIYGDFDTNGQIDQIDLDTYIPLSLLNTTDAESCYDLNGDSVINVQDAALINQCLLVENGIVEPDNLCDLPYAINNPLETITLTVGTADFENNTIQIEHTENAPLLGLQFKMEGLIISEVNANELGSVYHNENTVLLLADDANGFEIDEMQALQQLQIVYDNESGLAENICITDVVALNADRIGINGIAAVCEDLSDFADCAGIIGGGAEIDCNGECDGGGLFGDLLTDNTINDLDINTYSVQSISGNFPATDCTDLNGDGVINLIDGYLLDNCLENNNCDFPISAIDINSSVELFISDTEIGETETMLELSILGETPTAGLQFTIFTNQQPNNLTPLIDFAGGTMNTNYEFGTMTINMIRPAYNLGNSERFLEMYVPNSYVQFCLETIELAIDLEGNTKVSSIAGASCLDLVGLENPQMENIEISIFPNPFRESTTIDIQSLNGQKYDFTLLDALGNIVRQYSNQSSQFLELKRDKLPAGLYFYVIGNDEFSKNGKVMVY